MKLERKKNAVRNVGMGMVNKLITILFPFILRTVIIYTLGTEYLGLSSLFTSVLQVLSLSELGIGTAMVYGLYEPIATENTERIRVLVSMYRIIYRGIGTVILVAGLVVMPFLPRFIHGSYPGDINIYILYMLYLVNSASTYFISSYKSTLIAAHQRRDVFSGIGVVIHFILYIVQIFCLFNFENYYMYVIWLPIFTIIENICLAKYVNKRFPEYVVPAIYKREDIREIFAQVKDLFGHKLSAVVTNSVDTIVISAFLGLQMVTIYNNYFYLMSAISGVLDIIYTAVLAGIGNSLVSETQQKNEKDFRKFVVINAWIIGWCTICFLCLYQPMVTLWMGKDLLLEFSTVILLCVYFYVWKIRQGILVYKDAAGLWHADRFRPYIEIVVNLSINIILVQIIGINGIVISTIISMVFVSIPWETKVFFKQYMKKSARGYYTDNLVYLLVTVALGTLTHFVCGFTSQDPIWGLVQRVLICVVVPNIIIILLGQFNSTFSDAYKYILQMLNLGPLIKRFRRKKE